MKRSRSIAIVGGGPTGLLLGCLCAKHQLDFIILDDRSHHSTHSRSIGLHPPSLKLFEEIGLLPALLEQGNRIDTGIAHVGEDQCGRIDFTRIDHGPPYILTLAQSITESILEQHLSKVAPEGLSRAQRAISLTQQNDRYLIETDKGLTVSAEWVVACDGRNSFVRTQRNFTYRHHRYPDHYIMGDFVDHIGNRNEALVYLCREGLVESFPHSTNLRRWVLHTGQEPLSQSDPKILADQIGQRIGKHPDHTSCSMISQFQPEFFMADTFAEDQLLLAGDAAHAISPIGGQGMNLGWLDGAAAVEAIRAGSSSAIAHYAQHRRQMAQRAARRAEFNMSMGRPFKSIARTKLLLHALLHTPIKNVMSRRFTMHGLA